MTVEQRELLRKLARSLEDYAETRPYADAITAALDDQERLCAEHAGVTANVVHISSILEMQQRHFVEDEMQWRAEVERLRRQNEALSRENERGKLQAGDLVRAISSLRE
jgi:hypothetical protein